MSNLEEIFEGDKKTLKQMISERVLDGFDDHFSFFTFSSCNTPEKNEFSDIDSVLLLPRDYLGIPEGRTISDFSSNKQILDIRKELGAIKKEMLDKREINVYLGAIEGYFNLDNPESGLPSLSELQEVSESDMGVERDWGNLINRYRLFLVAMTGKTELGETLIEKLRYREDINKIPNEEGFGIYLAEKRNLVKGFFESFLGDKQKADIKISKAILRMIEGFRIIMGERPAYSEDGVYKAIFERGKIIFEGSLDPTGNLEDLVLEALNVRNGGEYELTSEKIYEILSYVDFSKKMFIQEMHDKNISIPSTETISNYLITSAREVVQSCEKYVKNGGDKKIGNIMLSVFLDEILELAEREKPNKGDEIYKLLKNFMRLKNMEKEVELKTKHPNLAIDSKVYSGRINLLFRKFGESKELFEDVLQTISENTKLYNLYSLEQDIFYSNLHKYAAKANIGIGNLDEAIEHIESSLEHDPLNLENWKIYSDLTQNKSYEKISNLIKKSNESGTDVIANLIINQLSMEIEGEGPKKLKEYLKQNLLRKIDFDKTKFYRDLTDMRNRYASLNGKILNLIESGGFPDRYQLAQLEINKKQIDIVEKLEKIRNTIESAIQNNLYEISLSGFNAYRNTRTRLMNQFKELDMLYRETDTTRVNERNRLNMKFKNTLDFITPFLKDGFINDIELIVSDNLKSNKSYVSLKNKTTDSLKENYERISG